MLNASFREQIMILTCFIISELCCHLKNMHQCFWFVIPFLVAFFARLLIDRTTTSALRSVPGPWLWSYTNAVRWFYQYFYDFSSILDHLHKQHGALVRIGPNTVSFNNPEWITKVYDARGDFKKVPNYPKLCSNPC